MEKNSIQSLGLPLQLRVRDSLPESLQEEDDFLAEHRTASEANRRSAEDLMCRSVEEYIASLSDEEREVLFSLFDQLVLRNVEYTSHTNSGIAGDYTTETSIECVSTASLSIADLEKLAGYKFAERPIGEQIRKKRERLRRATDLLLRFKRFKARKR